VQYVAHRLLSPPCFSPPPSPPSAPLSPVGQARGEKKIARAGEVARVAAVDKNIRRGMEGGKKKKKEGRKKEGREAPKYCNCRDLCGGK